MILLIIIPIYIALNLYILHRVHKWLTACSKRFHSKWFVVPYIVIYSLLALSLLFAFLLPSSGFQVLVKRISNYWLGTFVYILMFIAVADILRLILKRIPGKVHDFFFSKVGYVFVGIFLTALVGGMSAYGIAHSHIVKANPYEVTIRNNCGDNSDLKVVLIADLHLGYSVGDRQMQRMVKKINEQDADLVVFAGDIFDNNFDALDNPERLEMLLSQINSTYGTYAVFGNHDVTETLIAGFPISSKNAPRDPRMYEFLEKSNISVLEDETAIIDNSFYLTGRLDEKRTGNGTKKRASLDELTKNLDPSMPLFVISHEPDHLSDYNAHSVDIVLSGHTHAGQFFPLTIVQPFVWENYWGMKMIDSMYSFVTSGIGVYGPDMRVGTNSEVMVIDVHFE